MRRLSPAEVSRYDHVPAAVARRVRVATVPVLAPGADGMALGPLVLVRRGACAGRPEAMAALLAHELVHAHQWADLGVARFLWRYLGSYLTGLGRLRRHSAAYLAIPLEVEARTRVARWSAAGRPDGPRPSGQGAASGPGARAGAG